MSEDNSHDLVHWLLEHVVKPFKQLGWATVGTWICAGLVLGASAAVVAQSVEYIKHHYSHWICKDGVASSETGQYALPLVKHTGDDGARVRQVRETLEMMLPNHVSPVEICNPLSTGNGTFSQRKTLDTVGKLRRSYDTPLVMSIGPGGDGYTNVRFWQKDDRKVQDPASFTRYLLSDPADQQRLAVDTKRNLFLNANLQGDSFNAVFPPAYAGSKTAATNSAASIGKLQNLLEGPVDPDTACGIRLTVVKATFQAGDMIMARKDLVSISKSTCPPALMREVHDLLGQTCMRMASLKIDADGSTGALKCAEASFEIIATGPLSRQADANAVLASRHNLNFARFELSRLTRDPLKRQQALHGSQQVKQRILDIEGPLPGDIAVVDVENRKLAEQMTGSTYTRLFKSKSAHKAGGRGSLHMHRSPKQHVRKAGGGNRSFVHRNKQATWHAPMPHLPRCSRHGNRHGHAWLPEQPC